MSDRTPRKYPRFTTDLRRLRVGRDAGDEMLVIKATPERPFAVFKLRVGGYVVQGPGGQVIHALNAHEAEQRHAELCAAFASGYSLACSDAAKTIGDGRGPKYAKNDEMLTNRRPDADARLAHAITNAEDVIDPSHAGAPVVFGQGDFQTAWPNGGAK